MATVIRIEDSECSVLVVVVVVAGGGTSLAVRVDDILEAGMLRKL